MMSVDPCTRRSFCLAWPVAAAGRLLRAMPLSRFRLGITGDEIDEDVKVAAEFLREAGLHYMEVRSIWGKYNLVQAVEKVREARRILDEYKLETSVLDTDFFRGFLPASDTELDAQWKIFDNAIERARIFGTRMLRSFAFRRKPGEATQKDPLPRICELLNEAGRRARKEGVRLAIENLEGSYVATGADAARMLKCVRQESVGLTWDPNNAAAAGERSFPDGYRLLDPSRIFHVHLRDYKHGANGKVEWCAVGDGEFDMAGQLRALLDAGYKDTFSLETHWRSPRGKAYSTRTSLAGLLKVIEKM